MTREQLQKMREREVERLCAGPPVCINDDGTHVDIPWNTDVLQAIDRAIAECEGAA